MYRCFIFACFQSTGVLPGLFLDRPGLCLDRPGIACFTGAYPEPSGNDRGSTGMSRSFTWALPEWSGAHPGWFVWNYRSAAGISVTATMISPRIIQVTTQGWSWALPGVSETAALCSVINIYEIVKIYNNL
jgi:hypothetical protein